MPAKQKTLEDLFLETLKDIYHAEKQLVRVLPKMAKAADSDELRQAFETHRAETEGQVARLEQIFEIIGKPARGKPCEAMQGIVVQPQTVCGALPRQRDASDLFGPMRFSVRPAYASASGRTPSGTAYH